MKTELLYLVASAALTGLLWVPYILDRIAKWGLVPAVSYPENPPVQSDWARRLMRAHANNVENLVVFGVLVLAAQDAGVSNGATALAAAAYFWGRVVHLIAYTFAIPWVRTVGFSIGFLAQATFAWQLLVR